MITIKIDHDLSDPQEVSLYLREVADSVDLGYKNGQGWETETTDDMEEYGMDEKLKEEADNDDV